jgi:protein-tyrosine phosphatase
MTIPPRTSFTHPLAVDSVVPRPGGGRIGLVACPGRHDPGATGGGWARDLATDLDALHAWGAAAVTSLVAADELAQLRVAPMGQAVVARGMAWIHLPIADMSVPGIAFERAWRDEAGPRLHALLAAGRDIVLHCRAGLGRTGMIAARLLVESGTPPDAAIRIVRAARPGAIETAGQEAYVRNLQSPGEAGNPAPR